MATTEAVTFNATYTDASQTYAQEFDITRFIVLEAFVSFVTLVTLYIVITFAVYECKRPKNRRIGSMRKLNRKVNKSHTYAMIMRIESLLAALFLLSRFICEHYELLAHYFETYNADYCNLILKLKIILTAVCISCVYGFLWTRQNFFYSDPSMKHLSSPVIKAVSTLSLIFLFLAEVGCTVLFTTTRFYRLTPKGCLLSESLIPDYIAWICITVSTVAFQALLFGLFIYPLVKHRNTMDSKAARSRGFLSLIKRATVTAAICILTDIGASILILFVKDPHNIAPTLVFDANILINLITLIGTFRDWKPRVFAMCSPWIKNPNGLGDISGNEGISRSPRQASVFSGSRIDTPRTPGADKSPQETFVWSVSSSQKSGSQSSSERRKTSNENVAVAVIEQ